MTSSSSDQKWSAKPAAIAGVIRSDLDSGQIVGMAWDRDHGDVVFDLLLKSVGQASEPPHTHPHRQIVALIRAACARHCRVYLGSGVIRWRMDVLRSVLVRMRASTT